jgi:hypothetical protein
VISFKSTPKNCSKTPFYTPKKCSKDTLYTPKNCSKHLANPSPDWAGERPTSPLQDKRCFYTKKTGSRKKRKRLEKKKNLGKPEGDKKKEKRLRAADFCKVLKINVIALAGRLVLGSTAQSVVTQAQRQTRHR